MAQRIGPPGTARIAINGTNATMPWANVFWVLLGGGSTLTQAGFDAYVSAFGEMYFTQMSNELPTSVTITNSQGVLFQSTTQVLHSLHAMSHTGTDASPVMPNTAVCKVFSWTSGAYWRGGKPRTYVPSVRNADCSDGHTLNAAADTRLTTKANDLHVAINALTATGVTQSTHGFVKFMQQGVLLNPGVFYPISGGTIHPRLGTQRRRLGAWIP